MMKTRDCHEIIKQLAGRVFNDCMSGDGIEPCKMLLFCKDMHFEAVAKGENDPNPLALVIIDHENNYVVNNNFRFRWLVIRELDGFLEYDFQVLRSNNKTRSATYYFPLRIVG